MAEPTAPNGADRSARPPASDARLAPDDASGLDDRLARVAEALVFAADAPLAAGQIAGIYAEVTGEEAPDADAVLAAVARLNERYAAHGHALRVQHWGGGLRMATDPELSPYLKAFFNPDRQRRLSRSLLETLAILAYRQPVTKPELDFVRGVDSDYAVRRLLELGLVDVVGRSDSLGRPLLYGTTPRFLEQFGLQSLEDLPRLREIEDLLDDPAFNRERAQLLALEGLEGARGADGEPPAGASPGSEQPADPGVDL